jgi:hypothetical protein
MYALQSCLRFAELNAAEGQPEAARKLLEVVTELKEGVVIPPEVSHTHIEHWAFGTEPKRW